MVVPVYVATEVKNDDCDQEMYALLPKGDRRMSFEVFEKLEVKVQQAIDTITLLQMEIEELKEKNNTLSQEVQEAAGGREALVRENEQLKQEQHVWQDRLRALLGKMEEV